MQKNAIQPKNEKSTALKTRPTLGEKKAILEKIHVGVSRCVFVLAAVSLTALLWLMATLLEMRHLDRNQVTWPTTQGSVDCINRYFPSLLIRPSLLISEWQGLTMDPSVSSMKNHSKIYRHKTRPWLEIIIPQGHPARGMVHVIWAFLILDVNTCSRRR